MFASEMPKDPYPELLALHRIAFGQYEGVLPFDEEILRWYIRRPGLGLAHTLVVLYEDTIVSSLFLTVSAFLFEGNLIPVGIIDTVMTHPNHRGKGLATRLMKEAEAMMRSQGCWFGYLYTIPETKQFRLYQNLGYRDFQRVFHLQGRGRARRDEMGSPPTEEVRQFLNETLAGSNGFILFDEALWAWRKRERPEQIPARIFVSRDSRGRIQGTITASWGQITTTTGKEEVVFLSDWAGIGKEGKANALHMALSSVGNIKIDLLCPVVNREEWAILQENGFQPTLAESAMLFPLQQEAEALLQEGTSRSWYPLIESVVGV
ncbi:MAG: GNAT family N-acetyltransferase [Candidatus Atribacteria bacterium]|nr:GNAT family N-acetyltransferase [Candidatus Atribacteria bacterium]